MDDDGVVNLKMPRKVIWSGELAQKEVAALRMRADALEKMLLKCREEFCWHGNTGKSLNAAEYGKLVDEIDSVIDGVKHG